MKNNKTLLVIGQYSLAVGFICFLVNYFFLGNYLSIALIAGALLGASLVFNLTYIIRRKKEEQS